MRVGGSNGGFEGVTKGRKEGEGGREGGRIVRRMGKEEGKGGREDSKENGEYLGEGGREEKIGKEWKERERGCLNPSSCLTAFVPCQIEKLSSNVCIVMSLIKLHHAKKLTRKHHHFLQAVSS